MKPTPEMRAARKRVSTKRAARLLAEAAPDLLAIAQFFISILPSDTISVGGIYPPNIARSFTHIPTFSQGQIARWRAVVARAEGK